MYVRLYNPHVWQSWGVTFIPVSSRSAEERALYALHFQQVFITACYFPPGGGYPKLTGVAWHRKWENFGLITSGEGLVRELVAHDRISLVSDGLQGSLTILVTYWLEISGCNREVTAS